jgi:hypothetical protein
MLRGTTCALTTALALGALTACGGAPASDEDRVRETTLAFMAQLVDGDHDACEMLTADGRRQLEGRGRLFDLESCEDVVEAVATQYSDAARGAMKDLEIRAVTVRGDRATVRDQDILAPADLDGQLEINDRPTVLRRENGGWKIEDLG